MDLISLIVVIMAVCAASIIAAVILITCAIYKEETCQPQPQPQEPEEKLYRRRVSAF